MAWPAPVAAQPRARKGAERARRPGPAPPTARNGRRPASGTTSTSSPTSPMPSSWIGSSALSSIPQMTTDRDCDPGNAAHRPRPGIAACLAGGGHDRSGSTRIPVEHRGQRARAGSSRRYSLPLLGRDQRQVDMLGEALVEERRRSPSLAMPASKPGLRKALIYCEAARCSASSIRLFWKISGCGRIDDREPLDARIAAERRRPGDRAAPIVADQREAIDAQRVGERENVGDQRVGGIGRDLLRPVGAAEAAQVGHDQPEASPSSSGASSRQVRCDSGKPWSRITGGASSGPASATFMVMPVESGSVATVRSRIADRLAGLRGAG